MVAGLTRAAGQFEQEFAGQGHVAHEGLRADDLVGGGRGGHLVLQPSELGRAEEVAVTGIHFDHIGIHQFADHGRLQGGGEGGIRRG